MPANAPFEPSFDSSPPHNGKAKLKNPFSTWNAAVASAEPGKIAAAKPSDARQSIDAVQSRGDYGVFGSASHWTNGNLNGGSGPFAFASNPISNPPTAPMRPPLVSGNVPSMGDDIGMTPGSKAEMARKAVKDRTRRRPPVGHTALPQHTAGEIL